MVILITGDNLKANKQLAAILAASFAGDSFILTDLTVTPWLGASLDLSLIHISEPTRPY